MPTPTPTPQLQAGAADAADADREAAAVTALVERYFAVLNQRDADAALGLWSASADGRRFVQATLRRTLETSSPSWTNIAVSRIAIDGINARAHVDFDLTIQLAAAAAVANPLAATPGTPSGTVATAPAAAPPPPMVPRPSHVSDVMTFVREAGEWRIEAEIPESLDIANRLLAAPDDAARDRVLAEEGERVNFAAIQALFGLGGEANSRRDFATGIRATSLAMKLTEAKAAAAAGTPQEALAETYLLRGLADLAFAYAYKPTPDFPKAIEALTRAFAIQERNSDAGGAGDTLQARGNVFYASGDYSRALADYQQAVTLETKADNADGVARSRLGVGNVQFLFGQFDLSLDAYRQSLEAFEQLQLTEPQPRALQGLARVYAALGDYARSRDLYTRALTLLTAAPSRRSEQAATLLDIGHIFFLQGKLDEAAVRVNQALAIDNELNDPVGQGRALFALGLVQVVRARYDEAIETYTRCAESFRRADFADGLGQAILARAAARFERHDAQGALDDYTESARIFASAKNREGVARANVGLAMTHVVRQESKPALDAADMAWRMAEDAGAPEIGWQARYEAGRALTLAGDADRARQRFEESIATLERSQFEAGGDADAPPPARRAAPYVALVDWYVAHGDAPRALLWADAEKRRLLQDLLLPYRFRLTRGLTADQQREERRLFSQRVSLARQMRRERQRPAPDAARLADLATQLDAARAAAADLDRVLTRDHFETVFQRGDANFDSVDRMSELARQLNEASALVQFVVGDGQTTVLVATRRRRASEDASGADAAGAAAATDVANAAEAAEAAPELDVRAYAVQTTRVALAAQIAQFTDAIERRLDTVAAGGRALQDLLLGPAREQLADRTQLIIVPDDALWTLPFEALQAPADRGDTPPDPARDAAANRDRPQRVAITLLPSIAAWILQPALAPALAPAATRTPAATPKSSPPSVDPPSLNATPASVQAARPSSVSADTAAPTMPTVTTAARTLVAAGTISDVTPLQSTVTLLSPPYAPTQTLTPSPSPTQTTAPSSTPASTMQASAQASKAQASPVPATGALAAWELFDHPLDGDSLLVVDRAPADEQIRLEQGHLGAMALAWALQVAGVPRVAIARWPLSAEERERALRDPASAGAAAQISAAGVAAQPHEWAAWMHIGPPQPPQPPQPLPALPALPARSQPASAPAPPPPPAPPSVPEP
jgi:tetratricopeptide (TPR) repeat protein